jgi:hypothetical protein
MGKKQQKSIPLSLALGIILSMAPNFSQANSGASSLPSPASKKPAISMSNEEEIYKYQCRRSPREPELQTVAKTDGSTTNQSDAYGTAAEQASYLALYQSTMGPYGYLQGEEKRNKILQETAQAIDDCVNGRSCDEEKQKKVLKALVQLNQGLELRCMLLANQHNMDRLKTARDTREEFVDPLPPTYADTEFQYQKSANSWKFEKTKSNVEKGRSTGSSKTEEYFRIDENSAKTTINEQEIMGDTFIREYGIFIDNYSSTQREDHKRFYKFVPVGGDTYKFAENDERKIVDQEKFETIMSEQSAKDIQSVVSGYKEKVAKAKPEYKIVEVRGPNGTERKADGNAGIDFQEVGMGFNPGDIQESPGVYLEDLKKDGVVTAEGKPKAVVRYLNEQFRLKAEESKQRQIASAADPEEARKQKFSSTITLDPKDFDKFLDEIWPTGEKREQQRRGIFPPPTQPNN